MLYDGLCRFNSTLSSGIESLSLKESTKPTELRIPRVGDPSSEVEFYLQHGTYKVSRLSYTIGSTLKWLPSKCLLNKVHKRKGRGSGRVEIFLETRCQMSLSYGLKAAWINV